MTKVGTKKRAEDYTLPQEVTTTRGSYRTNPNMQIRVLFEAHKVSLIYYRFGIDSLSAT